jgi:hypothetical protein
VASIQASALTDEPTGAMEFHEWDLTPEEAAQVRELNRYAQVWSADPGRACSGPSTSPRTCRWTRRRSARRGQELTMTEQTFQGMPIRSLYYPLERMGHLHAHHVLQVAAPLTGRNEMLRQLAWLLAGITSSPAPPPSWAAGGWRSGW